MSGNRALLDTNGIIFLLQGKPEVKEVLRAYNWIGISIISKIKFLSYPYLKSNDLDLFDRFLDKVELIELTNDLENNTIDNIIHLRKKYKLKLPDSIIAASAITYNANLITADKDFEKLPN